MTIEAGELSKILRETPMLHSEEPSVAQQLEGLLTNELTLHKLNYHFVDTYGLPRKKYKLDRLTLERNVLLQARMVLASEDGGVLVTICLTGPPFPIGNMEGRQASWALRKVSPALQDIDGKKHYTIEGIIRIN